MEIFDSIAFIVGNKKRYICMGDTVMTKNKMAVCVDGFRVEKKADKSYHLVSLVVHRVDRTPTKFELHITDIDVASTKTRASRNVVLTDGYLADVRGDDHAHVLLAADNFIIKHRIGKKIDRSQTSHGQNGKAVN